MNYANPRRFACQARGVASTLEDGVHALLKLLLVQLHERIIEYVQVLHQHLLLEEAFRRDII